MKILGIANRKGGSGKSMTAQHLGAALVSPGCQVVLVDADPQKTSSSFLRIPPAGMTVLQAPGKLLEMTLDRLLEQPGIAIVDLPSHEPEPAAIVLERADLVLVPVTPSPFDIASAAPLLRALAGRNAIVVLSLVDGRMTSIVREARRMLEKSGVRIAVTEIRRRAVYLEAAAAGRSVLGMPGAEKAEAEVRALAVEVKRLLR